MSTRPTLPRASSAALGWRASAGLARPAVATAAEGDHSTIYDRIWGYDFGPDSKALAVYVGYLRRKTEEGGEPRLIHTVRGVGYTLRPP